jgi:hypothetical protein
MTDEDQVRTPDLFFTAYLLNNDLPILDIQLEERIKKKIVFVFPRNQRLDILKEQYKQGLAQANLLEFKKNYQHVQDLFYDAKRQHQML